MILKTNPAWKLVTGTKNSYITKDPVVPCIPKGCLTGSRPGDGVSVIEPMIVGDDVQFFLVLEEIERDTYLVDLVIMVRSVMVEPKIIFEGGRLKCNDLLNKIKNDAAVFSIEGDFVKQQGLLNAYLVVHTDEGTKMLHAKIPNGARYLQFPPVVRKNNHHDCKKT
jgi:hypothetical protein